MHRDEISYSIEYLDELTGRVAEAVKQGHTLEQTRSEVVMPDYADYSMYEHIHFQVNLPAVYNQLQHEAT
jgi:hypothetical protein